MRPFLCTYSILILCGPAIASSDSCQQERTLRARHELVSEGTRAPTLANINERLRKEHTSLTCEQVAVELGNDYKLGRGVNRSPSKTMQYLVWAAERGDDTAMLLIGTMYDTGDGVRTDHIEAYKWYTLSAAAGHNEQAQRLVLLANEKLSIAEIQDGIRRTVAWPLEVATRQKQAPPQHSPKITSVNSGS